MNTGLVVGLAGVMSGLIVAFLALALSRAPGWRELRWFALMAFTAGAYCFVSLVHVVPMHEDMQMLGERIALVLSLVYGLTLIRQLAVPEGRQLRRWERGVGYITAVLVALAMVPDVMVTAPIQTISADWFGATYMLATGTTFGFLSVFFILIAILVAAFSGRRWRDGWYARQPMLAAVALALAGTSDALFSFHLISMPQLVEVVTVGVVIVMGVSYLRRFMADAWRLEALSTKLELEVAVRTDELLKAQAVVVQAEKLAGLGRIAAGVAHEINNPTAIIQHNLDRMRIVVAERNGLLPELAERFDRSRAATQRIADIVRQLLETARPPSGDTASSAAFAVGPVVQMAIASATSIAPNLDVTVSLAESLIARGDPRSLEQALINLLVNAAHATAEIIGGAPTRIEGVRLGDRVQITVTDNGSGISEAIIDRLFEPFTTTKPIGEGTGLGLAVSRSLIARHGGTLHVGKTSSQGTVMVLELPIAAAIDIAPAPSSMRPGAGRHTGLRVLLIDDSEDLREVLSLHLDRFFDVDEAATVEQALEMVAKDTRYDAVICDLMMPRGGAEAWLARCTSVDPGLDARTIVLTGGPTTVAATALVEQRHQQVLYKPFEVDVLRSMIERVAAR